MKNYYQTLGVDPEASLGDIKKAYRQYAKKFHPDKQNGDEFFEDRFKEIQEAYQVLSSEETRDDYDESFYSFYSSGEDKTSKEDIENALREEYEKKLRNQEAEFKRRERRIKEEFEAVHNQNKTPPNKTASTTPNASVNKERQQTAKQSGDTAFNIFWVSHFLIITAFCVVIVPPAFYVVAYWTISLIIIQKELRLRWMFLNVAIFWIVLPAMLLIGLGLI